MSDGALEGLQAAASAAPEDLDLWIVYGARLLLAGRDAEAVGAAQHVLHADPAHIPALRLAADAARAGGRADLAVGYRRLLAALGDVGVPAGTEPGAPDPLPAAAAKLQGTALSAGGRSGGPAGDELDEDVAAPTVTLADVAGLEHVKRRLHAAFLGPLRNPTLQRTFRTPLGGGLLLYGPPGCGKTFLAGALAGELGAGFVPITITDVLDPYVGVSERNLHDVFEVARGRAPCTVFIDELDALGRRRTQQRQQASRGVVNQLLVELDSLTADNAGLFVLAATNHPWDVDVALRRPGRFDRALLVLPPDRPARAALFARGLRDRPVEDVDVDALARRTRGYSGADIVQICASAAAAALERSVTRRFVSAITMADLRRAIRELRASPDAWFEMARNYVLYANEGGEYDELAEHLRDLRLL